MPSEATLGIRFAIYPIARLVGYTVEGPVTDDQAEAFLDAVRTDRRFERGFDFLGECGENDAAYPPALARAVRSLAAEVGPCRWAVVSPSSEPGLVQQWVAPAPAVGVEVVPFLTRTAAIDWLDSYPSAQHPDLASESL